MHHGLVTRFIIPAGVIETPATADRRPKNVSDRRSRDSCALRYRRSRHLGQPVFIQVVERRGCAELGQYAARAIESDNESCGPFPCTTLPCTKLAP
jgi:hypothetical protein